MNLQLKVNIYAQFKIVQQDSCKLQKYSTTKLAKVQLFGAAAYYFDVLRMLDNLFLINALVAHNQ